MKEIKVISAAQARQRFAEITDEVRTQGVSYSITRHGSEVARLVAPYQNIGNDIDSAFTAAVSSSLKKYDKAFAKLAKL